LDRLDRVLGGESSHQQGQFAIGGHSDRSLVKLLYILWEANAAAIHFHEKLDDFHVSFPSPWGPIHADIDFELLQIPTDQRFRQSTKGHAIRIATIRLNLLGRSFRLFGRMD
jgi:hypothetical protein